MKTEKQEADKQLPPLGCELCKDSPAKGLIVDKDWNGYRIVKACACKIRRNHAKSGVNTRAGEYDAKAKAAGE